MTLRRAGWTLLTVAWLAAGSTRAEVVREGERFGATARLQKQNLDLHNVALLRVGWVFKVYVAGLYLADPADAERVLDDVPKRLELAYLRDLKKDALIEAAEQHLRKNFTAEQIAPLRERIERINSWYTDVKTGDRYTLTYLPGVGSELALNGSVLGVVPGADFAAAYFDVWLGEGCARPEFRDELLKRPAG